MKTKQTTTSEKALFDALISHGLFAELGRCDQHKCVDIQLSNFHLNIEVDGNNHHSDPEQIIRDLQRDHYSELEGFQTNRIPNYMALHHPNVVAKATAPGNRAR